MQIHAAMASTDSPNSTDAPSPDNVGDDPVRLALNERYRVVDAIGSGSFARVIKATDIETDDVVAIKIVPDKPGYRRSVKRELKILRQMEAQDPQKYNILQIVEYFQVDDMHFIVLESLGPNLYQVSKFIDCEGFEEATARKFTQSIVTALEALHANKIMHADLKPENILLKDLHRTRVKLIDFGISQYEYEVQARRERNRASQNHYIQSRYYRAPEVILGGELDCRIDVWSLGGIVAELLLGFPLMAGDTEGDQMSAIIEVVDIPSHDFLQSCSLRGKYFKRMGEFSEVPKYCSMWKIGENKYMVYGGKNEKGTFRGAPGSLSLKTQLGLRGRRYSSACIDFITRCLSPDPEERMSSRQALYHSWISDTGDSGA